MRGFPRPNTSNKIAIGERYDPQTWGPGGRAPLMTDNCWRGSGHHVRVGGSGSGKTQSLLSSLRWTWRGPIVALDAKQTLAEELIDDRRNMGRNVIVVDPRNAKRTGQNVLDWIDPQDPLADARVDDVVAWGCGTVVHEHGGGDGSKFFTGAALDVIRCCTSHIVADTTADPAIRSLRTVRAMICSPLDAFRGYLSYIKDNSPSNRARELASSFCETSSAPSRTITAGDTAWTEGGSEDTATSAARTDDTLKGIRYTAPRLTAWLSTECWADLVCGDAYRASDILDGNTDIFLDIPFQSLLSEPAVARCILGALFNAVFQRPKDTR